MERSFSLIFFERSQVVIDTIRESTGMLNFKFLQSEYIYGYQISSLQEMDEECNEVLVLKKCLRFSQGVVAKIRFFGPKLPRSDTFMME